MGRNRAETAEKKEKTPQNIRQYSQIQACEEKPGMEL